MMELALIPSPGPGHLGPMVELGKYLTNRDNRISVTVFIMEDPFQSKLNSYTLALLSNQPPPRMQFVHLTLDQTTSDRLRSMNRVEQQYELSDINKPRITNFYSLDLARKEPAAFIMDMFCLQFANVAKGFGALSYAFVTSNAHFLSLLFYLQSVYDYENQDITKLKGSSTESSIPGFVNLVPAKVMPSVMIGNEYGGADFFLDVSRKLRNVKGILVNTLGVLESYTIECLSKDKRIPRLHPVGPVLSASNDQSNFVHYEEIMMWLDDQPLSSVVFLCFGSMGAFEVEQVVEIAKALEHSGHRFLWALRKPPPKTESQPLVEVPTEYENLNDVLPEGFLDRTKDIGKVIGWAPQVAVLSHRAVGGFISHCGWNSILESLLHGVPIATWPVYAEQQLNAFEMVKEFGHAVEIKLDYNLVENPTIVTAEEIERGIKKLMEGTVSVEIRKKVNAMKEECLKAVVDGGSSYAALGHVIEDIINRPPNIAGV